MWSLYDRYHRTYRQNKDRTWVTNTSEDYKKELEENNIIALVGTRALHHHTNEVLEKSTSSLENQKIESSIDGSETPKSYVSSEHSRDSFVYANTKALFRDIHQMSLNQKSRNGNPELAELEIDTGDVWVRSHLARHQNPSPDIQKRIHSRFARNIGMTNETRVRRQLHQRRCGPEMDPSFCTVGLEPELDPKTQLALLKIQEKELLLRRWREVWDTVRPPRPKWYGLKTSEFSNELQKCRQLLNDPRLQNLEYETRIKLLDLQRMIEMDDQLSNGLLS